MKLLPSWDYPVWALVVRLGISEAKPFLPVSAICICHHQVVVESDCGFGLDVGWSGDTIKALCLRRASFWLKWVKSWISKHWKGSIIWQTYSRKKVIWYFKLWLVHLMVVNLDFCISLSLLRGKILVLDYIVFEVLVLKQACIILMTKTAKLKEGKN